MAARPSSLTSTRPVRMVVAVAMIAVPLVLTASVGSFVCGAGSARDVDRHTPAGSADRRSVVGGFVGRAVARVVTSAADVVRLYAHVSKMPESDRQLILGALASAPAWRPTGSLKTSVCSLLAR